MLRNLGLVAARAVARPLPFSCQPIPARRLRAPMKALRQFPGGSLINHTTGLRPTVHGLSQTHNQTRDGTYVIFC